MFKKLIIFTVLFLSLNNSTFSQTDNAKEYFAAGLNFYYLNKMDNALVNFTEAVKFNPDNYQYRFYLGKVFFKLNQYSKAKKEFETASSLKDNYWEAIKFLAETNYILNDYDKAIKLYGALSERFPNEFENHFKLGQLYFSPKINKLDKAMFHYSISLKLLPLNSFIHYHIGRVYLKQSKFPEAISKFDKAVSLEPSNGLFYYWRGNAYYAQLDFYNSKDEQWKSVTDFRKAMELGFDQTQTYFMFANSCLNRGTYYLNNNREIDGIELLKSAIIYYKKVIILQPDASNAYNNLGLANLGLNKIEDAIRSFKKAVELEPTVPFFHNNLGDAYYKLGNFKEAISQWKLLLELEPDPDNIKASIFGDKRDVRQKIRDAERRL